MKLSRFLPAASEALNNASDDDDRITVGSKVYLRSMLELRLTKAKKVAGIPVGVTVAAYRADIRRQMAKLQLQLRNVFDRNQKARMNTRVVALRQLLG